MLPEFGYLSLLIALCASVFLSALLWGKIGQCFTRPTLKGLAIIYALGVLFALGCLIYAFVSDDFSVVYVAQHSNTQLEWGYKIGATWGGHEGSMLLWLAALALWTAFFAQTHSTNERLYRQALGIMGLVGVAFCGFVLALSSPFDRQFPLPPEGRDLNPMLQDIGLIIHPPLLYLGYVGFAVNFALICAGLWQGASIRHLAEICRRWVLVSWGFLTAGIAVGSWWAYYELGWGGWWFWDPVENASLMPWLLATALLHTLIINQKRGTFSHWMVLLSILAFSLTLLGTFIVRAGVITSVHAFAVDPRRGWALLAIFLIFTLGGLLLFAFKARLTPSRFTFGLISKEHCLLWGNILLSIATLIVLIGTFYPMLFDALGWGAISVGAPYFNLLIFPLILLALALMIPSLHWRWNTAFPHWRKPLWLTLLAMASGAIGLQFCKSPFSWQMWLFLSLAVSLALNMLCVPNRKKLPMRLAHLGVAVTVIGAVVSSEWGSEKGVRLAPNSHHTLAGYDFHYLGVQNRLAPNYTVEQAQFVVKQGNETVATLSPERRYYERRAMNMSEVGIHAGWLGDWYVVMGDKLSAKEYAFRLHFKPLVRWIWAGAGLMVFGAFWAALRLQKRKRQ